MAFRWRLIILWAFLLVPFSAYAQVTLTGAMWFATTATGGTSVSQAYADGALNTLGGDQWWDLWLALNPDATSPVNGPSDTQSSIAIPLEARGTYKYYIFGQGPCCNLSFSGLNLFFDGNSSSPGISVFGTLNGTAFIPNANSSTMSLSGGIVPGSSSSFYNSAGTMVVLTGFDWNSSGTPPGDVCQEFAFTPASGNIPSAFGSFTLQVAQAAALSLSQASGAPGTILTMSGSGFAPREDVNIYVGQIAGHSHRVTTDASGSFSANIPEPQLPYGHTDFFAAGQTSGNIGAANFVVIPGIRLKPPSGIPGGTTNVEGVGFGAGEVVDVYWNNPRVLLGSTTANSLGSFAGSSALAITIPANASPGINQVLGIGLTTKAIGIGALTVR